MRSGVTDAPPPSSVLPDMTIFQAKGETQKGQNLNPESTTGCLSSLILKVHLCDSDRGALQLPRQKAATWAWLAGVPVRGAEPWRRLSAAR